MRWLDVFRVLRPRRCETLLRAVDRVLRRQQLRLPREWGGEGVLERSAELAGSQAESFAHEVAECLDLTFLASLVVPNDELLHRTGFAASELERRAVLPQPSPMAPSGFIFVVAFPEEVDRQAFRNSGIPLVLGSSVAIARTWDLFFGRTSVPHEPASAPALVPSFVALLHRVVADCESAGASEVFLGHPEDDRFECMTGAGKLSGTIHPGVVRTLQDILARNSRYEISEAALNRAVRSSPYTSFELALTRSFEGPVIYLGWSPQRCRGERNGPEAVESSSPGRPTAGGSHIAIVDDDRSFCALLGALLRERGYRVSEYHSGGDFLRAFEAAQPPPSLIVCDLVMPGGSGPEVVKSLRNVPQRPPVLVLTSDDAPEQEASLVLQGVEAFVRKQQSPEILLAWIVNLLARQALRSVSYA